MTSTERRPRASGRQRTRRGRTGRDSPPSPAEKATDIEPRVDDSPWADHEYTRGYAVLVLPFSTGHLLALRVMPQGSFWPYASIWHRPPEGRWSIYVDGPSLETSCPRYWGPVTERAEFTSIDVTWTGPDELRVDVDDPRLVWTMAVSAPPLARKLNAVNASLPLWTWKLGPLLRVREWLARRFLDLGDFRFAFTTASGHDTVFVPEDEYGIHESEAVLDGRSLGDPVRLETNPTIGGVSLPTRPSFAFGQAHMRITDHEEYERTRERVRDGAIAGIEAQP